ncbi:MAG TPA: Rrf2 family transcriptional regulator [Sedimentisphaerales bacterium]|nr:Rrf2 family transcriptional regulator [Sedimentisphaerales bacterium]
MKLSTRTRYGIRAVLELALNYGKGPLQTKVIARRQSISVKYLEQLMAMLKAGAFVRSVRGSKGGYLLARPPGEIRLSNVFSALEGPIVTVECLENKDYCDQVSDCIARQLWAQVQHAIEGVLKSITLQDLIDRAKNGKAWDYQI